MTAKKKKPAPPKQRTRAKTGKRRHRGYPDDFKATVLAAIEANGGDVRKVADALNVPYTTVYEWWSRADADLVSSEIRRKRRGDLLDGMEELAARVCGVFPDEYRANTNFQQLAVGLGVIVEKIMLLRQAGAPPAADPNAPARTAVDLTALTPAELESLVRIQAKLNGQPPPMLPSYDGPPQFADPVAQAEYDAAHPFPNPTEADP